MKTPRAAALTFTLTVAIASGCSGAPAGGASQAPGAAGSGGAPGPTPTASAAIPGGGTAAASAAAPTPTSGPTTSQVAGAGVFHVTLAGNRAGAGTYSGTMDLLCSSVGDGAGALWAVTGIAPTGQVMQISLQQNVSGFTTISITTAGDGDVGPWFARSDQPESKASFTVDTSVPPGLVTGHGEFRYNSGPLNTIDLALGCSSVNGGGGGTD